MTKTPVPRRKSWHERAIETDAYHRAQLKKDIKWTIRMTCKELNRSYGSVQGDLGLADCIRAYPKLVEIHNLIDALEWMRVKKEERKLR